MDTKTPKTRVCWWCEESLVLVNYKVVKDNFGNEYSVHRHCANATAEHMKQLEKIEPKEIL